MSDIYDVVIIGGGVTGTALLYELAEFTDLSNIAILEKYSEIAVVNSHGSNNSQTLHCGDIETNYTLEKAIHVRDTAKMVVNFARHHGVADDCLARYSKMVLAVGDQECQTLKERFETFKPHFPAMQWIECDDISKYEPAIAKNRTEKINAIGIFDEYTAVDFQKLSQAFVQQTEKFHDTKKIDVELNCFVDSIEQTNHFFTIKTNKTDFKARFVVVSTGGHSLLFAQKMGYGLNYSCMPIAGSFYFIPKLLNGKVYTMQNDKLPFAAIHGDPDLLVPDKTRLGPTALMLPVLERYNWKTFFDFLQVLRLDKSVLKVFFNLFSDKDIRRYMFKNILFEIPLIRRRIFLKDAQKIIPTLKLEDLTFASKIGGVRPVMIDKEKVSLHLGEAQINPGTGIIFNMTPSPGATSCLGNAEKDLRTIVNYLGCEFDEAAFNKTLKNN